MWVNSLVLRRINIVLESFLYNVVYDYCIALFIDVDKILVLYCPFCINADCIFTLEALEL